VITGRDGITVKVKVGKAVGTALFFGYGDSDGSAGTEKPPKRSPRNPAASADTTDANATSRNILPNSPSHFGLKFTTRSGRHSIDRSPQLENVHDNPYNPSCVAAESGALRRCALPGGPCACRDGADSDRGPTRGTIRVVRSLDRRVSANPSRRWHDVHHWRTGAHGTPNGPSARGRE
jgi:hypothetical protein